MLLDVNYEAWKFPRKSRKSTSKIPICSPSEVNLGYGDGLKGLRVSYILRVPSRQPNFSISRCG